MVRLEPTRPSDQQLDRSPRLPFRHTLKVRPLQSNGIALVSSHQQILTFPFESDGFSSRPYRYYEKSDRQAVLRASNHRLKEVARGSN